jgi:hypothetical protein
MESPETKFFQEFERLYRTGSSHQVGDTYYVKNGTRYLVFVRHWDNEPRHDHILIRLDKATGDILTPTGKVPIGNINSEYHGLETFDKFGPIYRNHDDRKEARIRELNGLLPIQQLKPPRDSNFGF